MQGPQTVKNYFLVIGLAIGLAAAVNAQNITIDAGHNGFTGWTETTSNATFAGSFLGNQPVTNTSGIWGDVSWGLWANSSATVGEVFPLGGNLAVGGSVTITISLGNMDGGSVVGFGLQNSSGTNRFESYYVGGSTDAWKLNDGAQEDITGPVTTWGFSSWSNSTKQTIKFTLLASNAYSLSFNNVDATNTGMFLGTSDISQVRIFNYNAGTTSSNNQYFNSLSVVPEPSAIALLGLGLAAFALRRKTKIPKTERK